MCLPTALKNILDELAERQDNNHLSLSLKRLNDICDYRSGMASSARKIPSRLNPELRDSGHEVRIETGIGWDDLQGIIVDDRCSLPIIEVAPEYFDYVENYSPRSGIDGYQFTHTIIPFKVNSQKVMFYDPFEQIFTRSSNIDLPPTKFDKARLYELWSRGESTRWSLWISERDQAMITQDYQEGQ